MNIRYNRFRNIVSTNYSQYFSIRDSILNNLLIALTLESLEFFNFLKNLLHFDYRFSNTELEYRIKLFMS